MSEINFSKEKSVLKAILRIKLIRKTMYDFSNEDSCLSRQNERKRKVLLN